MSTYYELIKSMPKVELNDVMFRFGWELLDENHKDFYAKVGKTQWFYNDDGANTRSRILEFLGYKVWDYALPQDWFDNFMQEKHKRPVGVWCYDKHYTKSIFGEFLAWSDVEKQLEEKLLTEIKEKKQEKN